MMAPPDFPTGYREWLDRNKGFTLLEVLVVLVLLSLLSGALFEGLSFTLRIRQGILTQMDRQRRGILQSFWIRSVISGTQPVSLPRKGNFIGQSGSVSGTSNGTLGGIPGAPGLYSLEFKKENNVLTLLYSDQYGSRFSLGQWDGAVGKFVFVYQFKTFDQWPPKTLVTTGYPQIPDSIMLQIDDQAGQGQCWVTALTGRREPKNTVLQIGI